MRKLILGAAFAFLLSAVGSVAQDVPAGFEEIGRFDVSIGGEAETFVGAREIATGKSYFNTLETAGFTSFNVAGKSIAPDAGARILSVLIGPFRGDIPDTATFELYDGPDILAANVDTGRKITLSNVSLDDDRTLTFSFEGEVVPATRTGGMMVPVDGGAPVAVSGRFTGTIPDAD